MKQGKKERGVYKKGDSKRGIGGENPIGETKALTLSNAKTAYPYYSVLSLPLSDSDGFDRQDMFQCMGPVSITYRKRRSDMYKRIATDKMFVIRFDGFLADPNVREGITKIDRPFARVGSWDEFKSHIKDYPSFDFLFRWCGLNEDAFEAVASNPNITMTLSVDMPRYIKDVGGVLIPNDIRKAKAKYNMAEWERRHPNQLNRVREVYEYNHKGE